MPTKVLKKRLVLKTKIKQELSKVLLTTIILLIGMILVKTSPPLKITLQKNLYEQSINFTKFKKIYQKYLGNILSIDKIIYEEKPVFKEKLTYSKINAYKDGIALTVSDNYMVPCLENGIIVFLGEKEGYGQTVIVEQENGVDVFYSNIKTEGINLYDYIEKGKYLGQTKSNKLYLLFQKEGKFLSYQDYL